MFDQIDALVLVPATSQTGRIEASMQILACHFHGEIQQQRTEMSVAQWPLVLRTPSSVTGVWVVARRPGMYRCFLGSLGNPW